MKKNGIIMGICLLGSLLSCANSAPSVPQFVSLELLKAPVKTTYEEGEFFTPFGMALALKRNDGTFASVSNYTLSTYDSLDLETTKITASYGSFSVDIPLSVTPTGKEQSFRDAPSYGSLNEDYEEEVLGKDSSIKATPEANPYDFHSEDQYAYLCSGYGNLPAVASGKKDLSHPTGLRLETRGAAYIEIATDASFASSRTYPSSGEAFYLKNIFTDRNYFYRSANTREELKTSPVRQAYAARILPRNNDVEGVQNVRDLGGYRSKLGGVVREGLYYRGGRLNVSGTNTFSFDVTEAGIHTLVDTLGIQSEIDLRMNDLTPKEERTSGWYINEYGSMNDDAIEDITYYPCPLNYNQSDMMKESKPMIGEIFRIFADPDNLPVYLHCNIGTDRTGMMSYLLGTLLGIPQEDLYRDYLFSNFASIDGRRSLSTITGKYQKNLLSYHQKNLYLDAREYLKDCGCSDSELDAIVDAFIDFRAL